MRSFLFGTIRKSLIFLVLLAVLPALAILLYTGRELRSRVVNDAENYALRQVQAMAAHHERVVDNARLLLMTLAKSSEVRSLDADACQALLADILDRNTAYVSLSLADVDGRILVAAPAGPTKEIGEAVFFQECDGHRRFTVGDYTLLKTERRVVVHFAQPVIGEGGQPVGILVADFDLSYFGRLFYDTRLPERSVFTLTDVQWHAVDPIPGNRKIHLGSRPAADGGAHVRPGPGGHFPRNWGGWG